MHCLKLMRNSLLFHSVGANARRNENKVNPEFEFSIKNTVVVVKCKEAVMGAMLKKNPYA